MDGGQQALNSTKLTKQSYRRKAGILFVFIIFVLFTSILYITAENSVSELNFIKRQPLSRSSHVISSISHNTSSQFYTVWNEENPLLVRNIQEYQHSEKKEYRKKIVVWNQWPTISMPQFACPSMPQCEFTTDREEVADADAVIFWFKTMPNNYNRSYFPQSRPAHQYWVIRFTECPLFTRHTDWFSYGGVFNWTMAYRADSDIYRPFGHITRIYQEIARRPATVDKHLEKNSDKLVIWYVSDCYKHLPRFAYATQLMKYIQVDVFGGCGREFCERRDRECFSEHLRQYKFYLSFENAICIEYITEKFWINALKYDVVPIVLGARKSDYERLTPPNSFIHVDDFKSPMTLANYLIYLSKNKRKYMEYFAWRSNPPNSLPDFRGEWCGLCKKLEQVNGTERKVYHDIDQWWRGANYVFCKPVVLTGNIRHKSVAVHYP